MFEQTKINELRDFLELHTMIADEPGSISVGSKKVLIYEINRGRNIIEAAQFLNLVDKSHLSGLTETDPFIKRINSSDLSNWLGSDELATRFSAVCVKLGISRIEPLDAEKSKEIISKHPGMDEVTRKAALQLIEENSGEFHAPALYTMITNQRKLSNLRVDIHDSELDDPRVDEIALQTKMKLIKKREAVLKSDHKKEGFVKGSNS